MQSTGWKDTFCLHVSPLLQQVRHEWYGTLKETWKVSVLTGCRFGFNYSQGIAWIIRNGKKKKNKTKHSYIDVVFKEAFDADVPISKSNPVKFLFSCS